MLVPFSEVSKQPLVRTSSNNDDMPLGRSPSLFAGSPSANPKESLEERYWPTYAGRSGAAGQPPEKSMMAPVMNVPWAVAR
jgi:hypothetical protein